MTMIYIFLFIGTIMIIGIMTIIRDLFKLHNHIRMLNHYHYICDELSNKTNPNRTREDFSKEALWVLLLFFGKNGPNSGGIFIRSHWLQ